MPQVFESFIPGTSIPVHSPVPLDPLHLLMNAYRNYDLYKAYPEMPTRPNVFRSIVLTLWGKNKVYPFEWHPWADDMSEVVHNHKYAAFAGCANCSKTTFAAVYALVNWACSPHDTLVMVTSTSLKDSQKRIWGAITQFYAALGGDRYFPGRLIQSQGVIRTRDNTGIFDDRKGIALIPGAKDKAKESIGRLIGIKQRRIFFIADEMPELSEALVEAAIANLDVLPDFQDFHMLGLGNLFSMTDPMGTFCAPTEGWDTVTVDSSGWATKLGWCQHFDGMKSPNFEYDIDRWPFLYGRKSLADHQKRLGENSVSFWRMCRAFIPPVGAENTIYSDAHFQMGRAMAKDVVWLSPPTKVAFLDPSFTTGGDRSAAAFGSYGQDIHRNWMIMLDEIVVLHEDASKKDMPRNYQIADKFAAECKKRGVEDRYCGLDVTAGGREFADRIADMNRDVKWNGARIFKLEFGGKPTDLPCNVNGNKKCSDAYDRRVTEIWYSGLDFVTSGQVRGLTYDLMRELKARKYELTKAGSGNTVKIRAMPKDEMKEDIGFSPDLGDAWCGMVQLIRERLRAKPAGVTGARAQATLNWKERVRRADALHKVQYA